MTSHNKHKFFGLWLMVFGIIILPIFFAKPVKAIDNLLICVSILPQQYFVQQIGKNFVDVQVMVPPGANPAVYEPKPAQMTALGKTRVYFSIGVPFEKVWLEKIAAINPGMRIIKTDDGIQKYFLEKNICGEPAARPTDKQPYAKKPSFENIPDPHIWLSPPLVMMQARIILLGLQQIDPNRREIYEQNHRAFLLSLIDMDSQLRKLFSDIPSEHFMVFHPAWGYFARAYGLTQVPVEIEGKAPKPAQLLQTIEYARQQGLTVILTQPQCFDKCAEQVARAIDGRVIHADPLALDWAKNLLEVAMKIKTALK